MEKIMKIIWKRLGWFGATGAELAFIPFGGYSPIDLLYLGSGLAWIFSKKNAKSDILNKGLGQLGRDPFSLEFYTKNYAVLAVIAAVFPFIPAPVVYPVLKKLFARD